MRDFGLENMPSGNPVLETAVTNKRRYKKCLFQQAKERRAFSWSQ
jgi:hypothetical protein